MTAARQSPGHVLQIELSLVILLHLEQPILEGFQFLSHTPYGCGSQPMVSFLAGVPPILDYVSGDWDVHWGLDLDFEPYIIYLLFFNPPTYQRGPGPGNASATFHFGQSAGAAARASLTDISFEASWAL